jgi:hypothetical protein
MFKSLVKVGIISIMVASNLFAVLPDIVCDKFAIHALEEKIKSGQCKATEKNLEKIRVYKEQIEQAKKQQAELESKAKDSWIKKVGKAEADKIYAKYPDINGQQYCQSTNDFVCNVLEGVYNKNEDLSLRLTNCQILIDAAHFDNFGNLVRANSDIVSVCESIYYDLQRENLEKYGKKGTSNRDHQKMYQLQETISRYK